MSRPKLTLVLAVAALASLGVGCKTSTGPGIHVGVRAEPKAGYKPPLVSPDGEVFAYGATVEPGPSQQAAPVEPGFDLIDYRGLGGIVVWAEPQGAAAPTTSPSTPLPRNAAVNLDSKDTTNFQHVYVTSVGGQVTFRGKGVRQGEYILRTQWGDVLDLPPVFAPDRPGVVEVLPAYAEGQHEPVALIYVAPTTWVRKVRNGQRVTFAPLSPGRYRVSTWHPVLPGRTQVVDVAAGPLVKLTLSVGVNSLPKPGR